MLDIQKENPSDDAVVLRLVGQATVEYADQLKTTLLEELQNCTQVQLNCDQVDSIDFFTLQLLCSAHRTSVARKKLLTFHGTPTGVVAEAVEQAGFARHRGCALCPANIHCMWT